MLAPELLKQIRRLELKAGHQVTEALAGNYQSAFKGRGMEFDEVREYVPGDDVRAIDWNVTARMRTPFVKVHREERELTIMLVVDVSASQAFGTTGREKQEAAAELAAVLAFLATRNNDKLGLLCFSDHIEHFVPPKKGRAHIWSIIRSVLTHRETYKAGGRGTDIAGAADYVMKVLKRRSQCFLISDFWADAYESSVQLLAKRHDLVCVKSEDPLEHQLVDVGVVAFGDRETGDVVFLDTGDKRVRAAYAAAALERDERFAQFCLRAGIDHFSLRTGESVVSPLVPYLRARERRRVRAR